MPRHDAVIVGAGPVGLLLGCLLTQRGWDVVVCERRADADPRTRAIGIHPPGLEALGAVGLEAAVRAEALALEGGDVRSMRRTVASLDFTPERPVLILPQRRTGALLRARLLDLSAGALLTGATATGLREMGDEVRVSVDAAGEPRELSASLVVIADGVRSHLREGLGLGWRRRTGGARYAMLDVDDASAGTRAVLHCEPGGLVESFPLPAGRRRWVVRQAGATPDASSFGAEITARTGIRPLLPAEARPAVFTASQHTARRIVQGRTVLLGDAAHEISPIGGQGMNLGWLDALRLSEVLDLRGGCPDLRAYQRRARRAARRAQHRSAFYMAMGAPASAPVVRGREAAMRMLAAPLLRERTTGMITMASL
ncbi:FAD-dependent oxidoreductase [Microbacterium sp. NPDC058342]|uniref:FAD-dependent oxidoreductase n=1 Tax=Microbacterium sp. NPDC058342 TaxID=3346454 RepID=UPI003647C2F2